MSSAQNTVVESQLRQARAALEDGLRSSADLRAEALLAKYPALAGDPEAALELVYTEFAVRENLGQNPDPADWYTRFPHWRTDLEQMFEVHRELKKEDALRQSRSRPSGTFYRPGPTASSPTIGEFEVLGEVGRGGMGVVYKARQASLGRVVAVKVILAGPHAGGRERERFKREAETAARLDHPNIVRIFAVGEHDGRPYCAMEYVDGASLADLLDGSPWADKKAAELVATAAAAAHHAHQNGVVHRDLKPANILLAGTRKPGLAHPTRPDHTPQPGSASGTTPSIKIVDFGLAKCLLDTDPGPTRTGDILGTPAYMSPEQANPAGGEVGPGTDVWGLGVTLYELLVGRPPFQGASAVETLEQVRTAEPVSPRRLRPSLPRDLEVICLKCLRKDPRHRYPTADALADDLTRFLRGEPILARPASSVEHLTRWCRRNPVVAGLSVAAVMLAVAAVGAGVAAVVTSDAARRKADELANQREATAGEQRELRLADLRRAVKLQVNEGVRLLNAGDFAGGAVILADAMAKDPDPDNEESHRIRLGTALRGMPDLRQAFRVPAHWPLNAVRQTPAGEPRMPLEELVPLVSEDGSTLLTPPDVPPLTVWDLAAGTGRPLTLTDADGVELVTLSSNGAAVVGLKGEVTLAWATATGQPLTLPLPPGFGTLPEPFTRDGARRVGGKAFSRQVYAADGTRVGKPIIHGRAIKAVAVSADGTRVATATQGQGARVWDMLTGEPVSPAIADDKYMLEVSLSRDGKTVYTSTVSTHQAWDVKTGQELGYQSGLVANELRPQGVPGSPYMASSGWESGLRVWDAQLRWVLSSPMPDTTSLLSFTFRPNGDSFVGIDRGRHARIWEPSSSTPLTPQLHVGESARGYFSTDGTRLTTVGWGGAVRVWDAPPLLPPDALAHTGAVHTADWLPGGQEVVSVGETGAIVSRAADGKAVRTFPHKGGRSMAVWPGENGRLATLDVSMGLRVWDLATGRPLTPAVVPPSPTRVIAFTPDGRLITGGNDGVVRFWDLATATQSGPPLDLGKPVVGVDISPDGKRVLVNCVNRICRLWELPSGRLVREFDLPPLTLTPALSPDGRTVCVYTRTTARVVSADDGTPLRTMDLDFNFRPTISPDGRYMVSPDLEANTVTVRDIGNPAAADRLFPHRPPARMRTLAVTAVSRDSRYLAISVDSSLTVWDMVRGVQVTPPMAVRYAKHMKFDDTARRLLVASVDKVVRVIDLSPDPRPVEELAERAALLANRQLDTHKVLVPLPPAEADRLWQKYRPK